MGNTTQPDENGIDKDTIAVKEENEKKLKDFTEIILLSELPFGQRCLSR